ncbi:MAG: nucleotidyl transferase AbiEii/AbiGii toxin family protein [Elusimicrobia bacterium]|nr:nucleotidyl transferase AbiEii/AbiGii toxin family protein [Elusimicrobiota bacterium]
MEHDMDEIARLPIRDRADLFRATAIARGDMTPALVEKDFWVCWTLRRIFTLPDPPADLVFKGGTSLSKVFQAIDRFSEDIDLSFDRTNLGFAGENDPGLASSKTQTTKRLEKLTAACRQMLNQRFGPKLEEAFCSAFGTSSSEGNWRIEPDTDDPDGLTLVFHYPSGTAQPNAPGPRYLRPSIRMEFGARGEQWPSVWGEVTPYAAQTFPTAFKQPSSRVKALAAGRTFWEKTTILHMIHYLPLEKHLPGRLSRHYYDLAKLYSTETGKRAVVDVELLKSVAHHKSVFFASAPARYDLAVPGTLRLVPPKDRLKALEDDYAKMREMIFGDFPSFLDLLNVVEQIERLVNEKGPKSPPR